MKKLVCAAVVFGGAFAALQAQAACTYPIAPGKIPDGNTATKEEMLVSKREVTQYDADMKIYVECIQAEYLADVAAQPDASKQQKADLERKNSQKQDAALAEVKDVVERFNVQLNTWKTKNGMAKKSS